MLVHSSFMNGDEMETVLNFRWSDLSNNVICIQVNM